MIWPFNSYQWLSSHELFNRIQNEGVAVQSYALSLYSQSTVDEFFKYYLSYPSKFLKEPESRQERVNLIKYELSNKERSPIIDKNSFEFKSIKKLLEKRIKNSFIKIKSFKWEDSTTEKVLNKNGEAGLKYTTYSERIAEIINEQADEQKIKQELWEKKQEQEKWDKDPLNPTNLLKSIEED
jgi:hypothetical protein